MTSIRTIWACMGLTVLAAPAGVVHAESADYAGGWTLEADAERCALTRYNGTASRGTSALSLPGGTEYLMFVFGKATLDPPREEFRADLYVNGARIGGVPASMRQIGEGGVISVELSVDRLIQANPQGFRVEVRRDGEAILSDNLTDAGEGFSAWRQCRAELVSGGGADDGDDTGG